MTKQRQLPWVCSYCNEQAVTYNDGKACACPDHVDPPIVQSTWRRWWERLRHRSTRIRQGLRFT